VVWGAVPVWTSVAVLEIWWPKLSYSYSVVLPSASVKRVSLLMPLYLALVVWLTPLTMRLARS
jgi:hypothetical protein